MNRDVNVSAMLIKLISHDSNARSSLSFPRLLILVAVNEAQNEDNFGTGIAISAAVIVILLIFILIVFLHR
jgi:hypothetical protein